MAIQHHPLSNAALGEFQFVDNSKSVETGHLITSFIYSKGIVTLDNSWKWYTTINSSLIEGTNDNPVSGAFTGEDKADYHVYVGSDMYDSIDSYGNAKVNPRLDQHSIDGMDDMAFGTELGSSIRSEADGSRDRISTNDISNNEEDEASTNTVREDIADKTNEMLANEFYEMTFIGQSLAESFKKD